MTERLNTFSVTLAQLNPTMGDVEGNAAKVRAARARAAADGADLVLFPELFIAGYPPEDLVQKPAFQAACRAAISATRASTSERRRSCSRSRCCASASDTALVPYGTRAGGAAAPPDACTSSSVSDVRSAATAASP